jgi:hypothetical protein
MLWYKSWLDTRWRFLLTLTALVLFACGTVMLFPTVRELTAAFQIPAGLPFDESLRADLEESREAVRTFRGYAWSQWFAGNFPTLLVLVAALLGSGSPLVKSGSGALFSLALPVSRRRWIQTRAGLGLAELFVVTLAPSLALTVLAPLVGEQLSLSECVVYGACAFVVASLFFSASVFLSTVFNDVWRPLLLTCLAAIAIAAIGMALPEGHGLFAAMAGESYFYDASLPWPELLLSGAGAVALVYAAAANIARRDF